MKEDDSPIESYHDAEVAIEDHYKQDFMNEAKCEVRKRNPPRLSEFTSPEVVRLLEGDDDLLDKDDLSLEPRIPFPLPLPEFDGDLDLPGLAGKVVVSAEDFVCQAWEKTWRCCTFHELPDWLKDNEFLQTMHRPELKSFSDCIKSIFRIHTETGNIWTHLLGCVAFVGIAIYFLSQTTLHLNADEQIVFQIFFACAIACLGFSTTFHTLHCHSEFVGNFCSRLDYCGIAIMITGSFVPWLYYGFYCEQWPKIIYLAAVVALGTACIIVSMWEKFSKPRFRPLRAGVFLTFGLSGFIPAIHYMIKNGWIKGITEASLQWLFLMAFLYVLGALLYAFRIPERYFPGKCDVIFQSHQIFHVLVMCAAFVHYHGISEMALHRMTIGSCPADDVVL